MALRKCACIDTLYTELDWLDRFQAAKNDGFEAVEFWDWRIRDLDATREAAEKAGIAISGFNGDAGLLARRPDPQAEVSGLPEGVHRGG